MAWRFTASKFKNTAINAPKKEGTIYDLPIGNQTSSNNGIAASSDYLAFLVEGEGGKLGVLPIDARGQRVRNQIGVICAHGTAVSDFCVLPFKDNLLATASRDDKVKIWDLSVFAGDDASKSISTPTLSVDLGPNRVVECIATHKTAEGILALGYGSSAAVVDVGAQTVAIELSMNEGVDGVQAADWAEDGKLLVVSGNKGKLAAVFDPRAGATPITTFPLHTTLGREGRVIFAEGLVVSSGFGQQRSQELLFVDPRTQKQVHAERFSSSTGVLIPLFDADTRVLYIAGKGTNSVTLGEFRDKAPQFALLSEQPLLDMTLGACLINKRGCEVMSGEVQRLFQLTRSSIVPYPCIVPRRSYREYHADLYPDTVGPDAGCNAAEWLNGSDAMPDKISLNPAGNSTPPKKLEEPPEPAVEAPVVRTTTVYTDKLVHKDNSGEALTSSSQSDEATATSQPEPTHSSPKGVTETNVSGVRAESNGVAKVDQKKEANQETVTSPSDSDKENTVTTPRVSPRELIARHNGTAQHNNDSDAVKLRQPKPETYKSDRHTKCRSVLGTVQSKFRHLETVCGANKQCFTNLRQVSTRMPAESNGFCVSNKYAAVPLTSSGGVVAICDLDNPGKVPDGVIDAIWNTVGVTDMQWNPFDASELACGLEDGSVKVWRIHSEYFEQPENVEEQKKLADLKPHLSFDIGKGERVTQLSYHPTASDILAVGLADGSVRVWDIAAQRCVRTLRAHSGYVLSLVWSTDGKLLATVGKDGYLKLYAPQQSDEPLSEATILESPRGARALFVCEDAFVMVVRFNKYSGRKCVLYSVDDNLREVDTLDLSNGTQLHFPHYDADTSVLFLAAKGDRLIHTYEISATAPHFLQLSPWTAPSNHQAISLQQKNVCDVRSVEFRCGWRLTEKTLEKISFKVPRKELFQRDVFPEALVTWEPVVSSKQWLNGDSCLPRFEDLRPSDMKENAPAVPKPCSSDAEPKKPPRAQPQPVREPEPDQNKAVQEVVKASWSEKIVVDKKLEQDEMDGVAEEEWVE